MTTSIIKVRGCYQMKKAKCMNSLSLENRKSQGNMPPIEKWNTKDPLSDDAVILPAIGKYLQYIIVQLGKKGGYT